MSQEPELPLACPQCLSDNYVLHTHQYDVNTAGSAPDCSWFECEDCGFQTDPE